MKTVIITGARAPVALHWARLLKAAGHRVVLADSQKHPLARQTRFKDRYHCLPRPIGDMPAYAKAWRRLLTEERPDLVLPTCEEVFFLAALRDQHGVDMPLFAPSFARLAAAHDKYRFAMAVHEMETPAPPPETWLLRTEAEARALLGVRRDVVLKPVWSRFGDRVLRKPTEAQITGIDWAAAEPWVGQAFLPGEELSVYALACEGKVLAHQAYSGLFRAQGGASVAFARCDVPEITRFVEIFVAHTRWHGQVSFDFRRDGNGSLHVIECNPRAVSGLHFFAPGDGLVDALFNGEPATPSLVAPQTVKLAMLTYGLADALSSGRVKSWLETMRASQDLTRFPGDRNFLLPQLMALVEIVALSLKSGLSLKAAATIDTEWNGEAL